MAIKVGRFSDITKNLAVKLTEAQQGVQHDRHNTQGD